MEINEVNEIKQAAYKIKKFCESHSQSKCATCPLRITLSFGIAACRMNLFGYVGAYPRELKVNAFENNDD